MAITVYKKTALLGGAATALDGIDGAGLLDGDLAFTTLSGVLYVHILDADEAGVESSPTRITPDANPGDKRWILQETYLKGVTSSIAELNILTGVTAAAAELNLIDGSVAGTAVASKALVLGADKNVDTLSIAASGLKIGAGAGTAVTATAAELNHSVGVTSAIQTQLNTLTSVKAATASPTFTGTVVLPSTTSIGTVTNTEIGYLDNVTSAIQTQLDSKAGALTEIAAATILNTSTAGAVWTDIDVTAQRTGAVAAKWAGVYVHTTWATEGVGQLTFAVRKNGSAATFYTVTQLSPTSAPITLMIPLDANEIFEYYISEAGTTSLQVTIVMNTFMT